MKIVMTIAGSDSSGGAGLQADLKTFAAHGVYGTSVVTAITAQNTVGITEVMEVPSDIVTAQIEAIAGDMPVLAVKTGMLANQAIVEAVAAAVDALELPNLVVDPVMAAKSGDALLAADAVASLKSELLRRAHVVTPNIEEASVLAEMPVRTLADVRRAAERIHALGVGAVVVTGGHLSGPEVIDVLYDGDRICEFSSPRIDTINTHGTGCTFAAALVAHLARGVDLTEAVRLAKAYVTGAIRHGRTIGRGHGVLGHLWNLKPAEIGGSW